MEDWKCHSNLVKAKKSFPGGLTHFFHSRSLHVIGLTCGQKFRHIPHPPPSHPHHPDDLIEYQLQLRSKRILWAAKHSTRHLFRKTWWGWFLVKPCEPIHLRPLLCLSEPFFLILILPTRDSNLSSLSGSSWTPLYQDITSGSELHSCQLRNSPHTVVVVFLSINPNLQTYH